MTRFVEHACVVEGCLVRNAAGLNGVRPLDEATETDGSLLRSFLRDRDIPCPSCMYNLRGLPACECPECGAPLSLHVGSPKIQVGPWLMSVIAMCVPLGFSLVMLAVALVGSIIQIAWAPGDWTALTALLIAAGFFGGVVRFIVTRRHDLMSCPLPLQWLTALVTACVAASLTAVLVAVLGAALR